jgi:hypothetical protein
VNSANPLNATASEIIEEESKTKMDYCPNWFSVDIKLGVRMKSIARGAYADDALAVSR